jgi:hypothetical protein
VTGSLSSTGNGIFGSGNANANIEAKSSVNTGGVGGSYVIFSAANAAARGYIEYAYATDKMTFATGGGSGSMVLDYSGNLGLGVSPSAYSGLTAGRLEVGAVGNSLFSNNSTNFFITNNTNYNNGFKFATATAASYYLQTTGAHKWYTSTTAPVIGNDPSFSNVMTLDASGNLLVAKTTADPTMGPNTKLQASVMGMGTVSGATTGAVDTGIPINAGESGGTIFLIANRNTSNGTSTDSAVYIVRLYYDGNNAPTTVYVGGSNNFVTFGVSGSQTLTVTNAGGGNATFSWIISS